MRTIRLAAAAALPLAAAVALAGCTVTTSLSDVGSDSPSADPSPAATAPIAAEPTAVAPHSVKPSAASVTIQLYPGHTATLAQVESALTSLKVRGKGPMTGYQRTVKFGPAWMDVDHNGCSTRDDVLKLDLTSITYRDDDPGCTVATGTLHDAYTGKTIHFVRGVRTSLAVQVDHLVPLGNAWTAGAPKLTQAQREALANDPLNLQAVDGPTNGQKSDSDASAWMPPQRNYWCTYISRQVLVKQRFGLSITPSEKAMMTRVLTSGNYCK